MTPPTQPRWLRWPDSVDGPRSRLGYGADYNPEQWPREVWRDDVRLMRDAGVNIVTLAVFSWARLQPTATTWDFSWLDEIMDLLHENGIAVDLGTATASPPPWLTTAHPEILPVTIDGEILWPGSRQQWRPTSPVFREHALRLVEAMAERYGQHPALAAWHVSNELGCHNIYDYSDDAARAFRDWLRVRYGTVDALNTAWGTAFWAQTYSDWDQVLPPRKAPTHPNPTQQLDFKRFSSDALRDYLRAESDVLRALTPDVPITTNFMVMGETKGMNYADWAGHVDFVSNDHYYQGGKSGLDELSFSANLTSNIGGGMPWYLMEHATSAVNWQEVNLTKSSAALVRDALAHVAHGADAIAFFQWRASASGAEKYHSAMVPHAGEDSEVFRTVVELGTTLGRLAPVAGTRRAPAHVAVLFDWDSWWGSELDSHPTSHLNYRQEALDWYQALLDAGVRVDVVPADADLRGYTFVVAPTLYVTPSALADRLRAFVDGGGHLVTTYFSGIVDEDDRIYLGGYPGALRELLGIRVEEFAPLNGNHVELDNGATGTLWSEPVDIVDPATVPLASYRGGTLNGRPAITRRSTDAGSATYVSTRLGRDGIGRVLPGLLDHAAVRSELPSVSRGAVELVVRTSGDEEFWFLVNRTPDAVRLSEVAGEVLVGERDPEGHLEVRPQGVVVLRV